MWKAWSLSSLQAIFSVNGLFLHVGTGQIINARVFIFIFSFSYEDFLILVCLVVASSTSFPANVFIADRYKYVTNNTKPSKTCLYMLYCINPTKSIWTICFTKWLLDQIRHSNFNKNRIRKKTSGLHDQINTSS